MGKINEYIEQNILSNNYDLYILIGIGAVCLLLFVIMLFKTKRLPVFSLILLLIAALGYAFVFVVDKSYIAALDTLKTVEIMGVSFQIIVFELALAALVLIAQIIIFIVKMSKAHKKVRMLELVPSNIDTNIYAYLNKRGKILYLTNRFYVVFQTVESRKRKYKKAIKNILVNKDEITLKELKKYVKSATEPFDLDFILVNEDVVSLTIEKREIVNGRDKLIGYVLLNQKETIEVRYQAELEYKFKSRLYTYIDLMGEAAGFYDPKTGVYNLTQNMMKLLDTGSNEMSLAQFEALVSPEDLGEFRKRQPGETAQVHYFKVKTINDLEWFEEDTYMVDNEEYYLIRKANFLQYRFSFKGYDQLLSDLDRYYAEKRQIGLVLVSLDNIKEIVSKLGRDFSDVLIEKYFKKLSESTLRDKYKSYRVSNLEFALIIERIEDYQVIIRDLSKDISDLAYSDVYFNEVKYTIKASVGLVDSKVVIEQTTQALMKAAFDALYMATDKNYANNYCIYYPKTPSTTTYRFEDYKIDLTDKDVDDILK